MTAFCDESRELWDIIFIDHLFIVIVSFIFDFADIDDDKIIQKIFPKHKEYSIVTLTES